MEIFGWKPSHPESLQAKGSASEADAERHDGNLGGWFGWMGILFHTTPWVVAGKRHRNGESWGLHLSLHTYLPLSGRIEWIPLLRLDQPVISTVRWRQEWSFCPKKRHLPLLPSKTMPFLEILPALSGPNCIHLRLLHGRHTIGWLILATWLFPDD